MSANRAPHAFPRNCGLDREEWVELSQRSWSPGSQRQKHDLPVVLGLDSALLNQHEIVDALCDRCALRDDDDARHALPAFEPFIRVARDRVHVVAQDDSAVFRGPSEDRRIIDGAQPHLLRAHDVEGRLRRRRARTMSASTFSSARNRTPALRKRGASWRGADLADLLRSHAARSPP